MEHFLFLRHVLNRCSFWDNCVWKLNLCSCFRCNTQISQITNFKLDYLDNDLEVAVKTKNTPFFMIFPNISFLHRVFFRVDYSSINFYLVNCFESAIAKKSYIWGLTFSQFIVINWSRSPRSCSWFSLKSSSSTQKYVTLKIYPKACKVSWTATPMC